MTRPLIKKRIGFFNIEKLIEVDFSDEPVLTGGAQHSKPAEIDFFI